MKRGDAGLERFRHAQTAVCLAAPGAGAAVRAYIRRDTGPAAPAHLNRFPAAPFCTITWFLSGTVHDGASPGAPVLAACVVGGPFTRPAATFSAGPLHALTVVFHPDAFARLTGLKPASLANRLVAAADILPAPWLALLEQVVHAPGDAERIALVDAFVSGHPGNARERSAVPWLRRLLEAAGCKQLGERQVERRIRQATGQSLRALRCAGRFETALLAARLAAAEGRLHWASLAGDFGFSDQPHLGRECRRLSGTSPADLVERQAHDESYWLYRHWR